VAAVWQTLLSDDNEWLAETMLAFELTHANLEAALEQAPASTRHRALATLLRNRVVHGGILAPGSGLIRTGENGKGLASRWYPETLCRRIREIGRLRHRIDFRHADAFDVLDELAQRPDVAWFIDPPYHQAGRRLYSCHAIDHAALFARASRLGGPFLMTYDNADEIQALAAAHGLPTRLVPMKTTHHRQKSELVIEGRAH
jgi:DNA adenine methylase